MIKFLIILGIICAICFTVLLVIVTVTLLRMFFEDIKDGNW